MLISRTGGSTQCDWWDFRKLTQWVYVCGCVHVCVSTGRKTLSTSWRPVEISSLASHWESKCSSGNKSFQYIIHFNKLKKWFCWKSDWFCCLLLCSDTETLVGLPRPIHESVKTLKQVSVLQSNRCRFPDLNVLLIYLIMAGVLHDQYSYPPSNPPDIGIPVKNPYLLFEQAEKCTYTEEYPCACQSGGVINTSI